MIGMSVDKVDAHAPASMHVFLYAYMALDSTVASPGKASARISQNIRRIMLCLPVCRSCGKVPTGQRTVKNLIFQLLLVM